MAVSEFLAFAKDFGLQSSISLRELVMIFKTSQPLTPDVQQGLQTSLGYVDFLEALVRVHASLSVSSFGTTKRVDGGNGECRSGRRKKKGALGIIDKRRLSMNAHTSADPSEDDLMKNNPMQFPGAPLLQTRLREHFGTFKGFLETRLENIVHEEPFEGRFLRKIPKRRKRKTSLDKEVAAKPAGPSLSFMSLFRSDSSTTSLPEEEDKEDMGAVGSRRNSPRSTGKTAATGGKRTAAPPPNQALPALSVSRSAGGGVLAALGRDRGGQPLRQQRSKQQQGLADLSASRRLRVKEKKKMPTKN